MSLLMIESVLAGRSQDRDEALKRAEITYEPCWMCAISVLDPESYLLDRRYCEADKGSGSLLSAQVVCHIATTRTFDPRVWA